MYMVLELWTEDALQASVIRCYICAVYNVIYLCTRLHRLYPSLPGTRRLYFFSFYNAATKPTGRVLQKQFLYTYIYTK